ncbi:MAG: hypothetical protein AMJ65_14280 [Phycisphaerae bacterium SG8_4]|nr:MAG: hypothetical protein AMJ65_14280 [Phycisphaerae bacterium SG8_4]
MHLRLHLIGGHVPYHFGWRPRVHVRVAGGVALVDEMAVVADAERFAAQCVRGAFGQSRSDVRNTGMAPGTRFGLYLARFELVVSIEGHVILTLVALEAEGDGVGYGASSQKTAVGQGSRPADFAVPGDIVAGQATERAVLQRKHRSDSMGHLRTRGNTHGVGLGRGKLSVVARPTQLRRAAGKTQGAPDARGRCVTRRAQCGISVRVGNRFNLIGVGSPGQNQSGQ